MDQAVPLTISMCGCYTFALMLLFHTDLQSDSFEIASSTVVSFHWLRVKDNFFLSFAGEQLTFEDLNNQEKKSSGKIH